MAGLIAGASLSIDYVLTVAVSTAAGIAALTSYFPGLEAQRVPLCLLAVFLVMLANLRGVSSSAKLLSLPTSPRWNTARTATASVWWCCRSS